MRGYQLINKTNCICDSTIAYNVDDAIEYFESKWSGKFDVVADFNGVDDDSEYDVVFK